VGHLGVPGTGFFAIADGKFGVDIIDVGLDGAEFDELSGGDFFVGFAFGELAEDQDFFGGQQGQEVFLGSGRDGSKLGVGILGQGRRWR
jgi:hypothetical protein